LYLNGFPKSGLHLAELMVSSLYAPAYDRTWFGTNAWTTDKLNMKRLAVLATIDKGEYMKGHSGWSKELEDMLIGLQVCMVFIYRDLRDVVVSQAYHIKSDSEDLKHPGRDLYTGDLQDTMQAVISGLDENDNLFIRWKNFKRWIGKPWVFAVRYEDLLHKPHRVAGDFIKFLIGFELRATGKDQVNLDKRAYNHLVNKIATATRKKDTVTYRKGKTKQWKREFAPDTMKLFETTAAQYGESL